MKDPLLIDRLWEELKTPVRIGIVVAAGCASSNTSIVATRTGRRA